jgi:hypothetical protein
VAFPGSHEIDERRFVPAKQTAGKKKKQQQLFHRPVIFSH